MNLANLSQEEKDKINVDLTASGVAYKERLNMPVLASKIERQQPIKSNFSFLYFIFLD